MSGESTVVVGGTSGIGRELARELAERGDRVFVTGRDAERASAVASELGAKVSGIGFDLSDPDSIAPALAEVERVDKLVIAAIERDANSIRDYDIARALRLVTLKLVGYAEVVHVLADRFGGDAAVVLFGGIAHLRPYPGSTTVSTVNGGVTALTRTLAVELAPVRVNAIHPGIIGDSPAIVNNWTPAATAAVAERTPLGRLVTMEEIVGATLFLLTNAGVNGVNLEVDGGSMHM